MEELVETSRERVPMTGPGQGLPAARSYRSWISVHNRTYLAGLLVILSLILLVAAFLMMQSEATASVLFLSSLSCFIGSNVLVCFSREDPIDSRIVNLLLLKNQVNLCILFSERGVKGTSLIIPPADGHALPMQLVPFAPQEPAEEGTMQDPGKGPDPLPAGILISPPGLPLLQYLIREFHFSVPRDESLIGEAITEICVDLLEIARDVQVHTETPFLSVRLAGYAFTSVCDAMHREHPGCCTRMPCPVCSLLACVIAEGTGGRVSTVEVIPDLSENTLSVTFVTRKA